MQHHILVTLTVLCIYTSNVAGQQLGFPFTKYIASTEYRAGMQNNSVVQDTRGFIYIANNFGLLEFDGSEWTTYSVKDGSKVRHVNIDGNGKIHVAAQGEFGYFLPDLSGALEFRSLTVELPDSLKQFDEVWKVFIGENEMYYCTTEHVYLFKHNVLLSSIKIEPSTSFFYVNNVLFTHSDAGNLQYIKNGQIKNFFPNNRVNQNKLISVLINSQEELLFVYTDGTIFNQDGIEYKGKLASHYLVNGSTLNTAKQLRNGNIAFGAQNNGLFILSENGKLINHLTKGKGLNDRVILSILEDRLGNLWLGHNNGISIVELSLPFTHIGEELGVQGSGYDAFNYEGQLFLATNNALYDGSIIENQISLNEVANTSGQNYGIFLIRGKILLSHHRGAFEIINGGYAKMLNNAAGYWTFKRSPINPNSIIAGSYNGLSLFKLTEDGIKFIQEIKGFYESSRVMEFDDFGDLWMTHGYKGVYRISLSENQDSIINVRFYGTLEGLPNEALVNVFKINNDLIFTTQNGLYSFDYSENRFLKESKMTKTTGIDGSLNYLSYDSRGSIYFLAQSKMGISQLSNDGRYHIDSDSFNKINPLINNDLSNISIINSNNVLFGAQEGFIVYNPSIKYPNTSSFKTYIRDVALTSNSDSTIFAGNFWNADSIRHSQDTDELIALPYENNSVHFRYSSNYMNDFDKTKYQHKLVGFENEWSSWQDKTFQEYTNLPKGNYVFKVRAKNIYNLISDEAIFSFQILPPWYMSKYAITSYFVVFLGSFILILIFIDRRYSKSKEHFEKEKQLEVDQIGNKLKSVTKEKTTEIEKLKSEKLESEIEFKNTELATSTMNLINKNKFIGHIKGNINTISKKSKSPEVIKELDRISIEIDKNLSHDDDWKQFAFHFNSVHGDFTTRITSEFENLSAQELRLCSYLRLNLSTKEIAQLLNISVRGVEIGRYRLRKKLNLERNINLSEFILNY